MLYQHCHCRSLILQPEVAGEAKLHKLLTLFPIPQSALLPLLPLRFVSSCCLRFLAKLNELLALLCRRCPKPTLPLLLLLNLHPAA
jgi:hypothetical protein